jgi:hypothetical protein
LSELVVSDLGDLVLLSRPRSEFDEHLRPDRPVDDADARDGAAVAVVIRVEDQRAQRPARIARRRRNALDDRLEQGADPDPLLRAYLQDVIRVGADQVVHFLRALRRLGAWQVDLVQDGDDLQAGVERQE